MVRRNLIIAASFLAILLFVAALPFVALLAFMLRGLLLFAIVGAAAAYACSAGFREWLSLHAEPFIQYRGLRLARDVRLHPGHSWARIDRDVAVGVDDLVQAALGPVEGVELPADGTHVSRGQRLFRLRHGERTVDVPSPVAGTVLTVNSQLVGHPGLINSEPFASGWAVRIHSDDPQADQQFLLRGRAAKNWFETSADQVIGLWPEQASVSDAHLPVGELYQHIDDQAWCRLVESLFADSANSSAAKAKE